MSELQLKCRNSNVIRGEAGCNHWRYGNCDSSEMVCDLDRSISLRKARSMAEAKKADIMLEYRFNV